MISSTAIAEPSQKTASKKTTVNFAAILETATAKETIARLHQVFSVMEPSPAQPPENYRHAEAASRAGHCSAKQVLAAVFELAAPKRYLEIGTRRGHSLCVAACSAPAPFDVYSFGLWTPNDGGEENPGPNLVLGELAKFGFQGHFNVVIGDSKQTVPEFFANPNNPQWFDMIYVDGDHSDEGARADLENTVAHLAPGGFMLFDDLTNPKHLTLLKVWKDFVSHHPELEDLVELRYEYGWALARRRNPAAAAITPAPSAARVNSAPVVKRSVSAPAKRTYTDNGFWTPTTFMFRAIQQWFSTNDLPAASTALSIDRNPLLDEIVLDCWPGLRIERAIHPQHDAQRLAAFADDQFDLVYSNQVLEHLPKPWLAGQELVRVLKPGGIGLHTTCAFNPLHGPPDFNDYYRFFPDGLAQLFDGVDISVVAGWGNREALAHNLIMDDGHGTLGGRRFHPLIGQRNDKYYPWVTWIIFTKRG